MAARHKCVSTSAFLNQSTVVSQHHRMYAGVFSHVRTITDVHKLTEHGHVLQGLQTPAAPQCCISMAACVTPRVEGWFCAKRVQDSEATPRMIKSKKVSYSDTHRTQRKYLFGL